MELGSEGEGRFGCGDLVSDRPRQEVGDPIHRMLGDPPDDETQIGFGVEAIELGGTDQAVDGCGTFAAGLSP